MSRMRKERNRQKKTAKEQASFINQQRARISRSDVRPGLDQGEVVERLSNMQRFKIDSESAQQHMADKEREFKEIERKMSPQND